MGIFSRLSAILVAGLLLAAIPRAEAQVGPGGGAVYTFCYGGSGSATVPSNWVGCPSSGGGGGTSNVNVTQWATTALGAPSNYGTSPGAVIVPGVNAFITNSVAVTATGATSNASSAVATSSTNLPTVTYNYGFNGTTWDQLQVDASKYLKINCVTGCAGGTTSNASSAVATSATNGAAVSWLYGFNGTTWDQLQVDGSKFLKTTVAAALPAGTAIIGKVGIDQTTPGTTNAVSATNFPSTVATGTGAQGATVPRFTVATDSATVAGSASLPAGTNLIGKTGIDQTTVGTTNGVSLAQIGAVTVSSGTGAVGTGSQRVAVGTDTATIAGSAPGTLGTPSANYVSVQNADPCTANAKTNVTISTATATVALVTGVSAKKIYICSFSYVASAADAISLAEGSSSTCGTSNQAGVIGVATSGTVGNGLSLAANGGLTFGNGGATVASTATNANYLCLFHSAVQGAGNLTYVQQ